MKKNTNFSTGALINDDTTFSTETIPAGSIDVPSLMKDTISASNRTKDKDSNKTRKTRVTLTVDFESGTTKSLMGEFYDEMERGIDSAMDSGNWNGDGPFYDHVERHSLDYLQLKKSIRIFFDVWFEPGTSFEMMEGLHEDIEATLTSMIDSGNWNGDGSFYDAMSTYGFGTMKIS